MPLTVVYEWVGATFYKTFTDRVWYLSLFLGLFWFSQLTAPVASPCLWSNGPLARVRQALGVMSIGAGAVLLGTAVWWLMGARFGWPSFTPPVWLHDETRRCMLPIYAAWPLALGCSLLREPRPGPRSFEQLGSLVALAFVLHIASGVRVQALPVLSLAHNAWLLRALVIVLLAQGLLPFGSSRQRLFTLVAAGFVLQLRGIQTWAIDPAVRDMLALVEAAQDRFASGHAPYTFYAMQRGSELPLTYLPGLWLGYGVPRLFGLDLRYMGPLLEAVFLLLLGQSARQVAVERRAWAEAFVGCFAAVWLFSPSVLWNVIYAEPALWWGLLGLLFTLAFSGRQPLLAALVLGYAVATRHFALLLAPFVLLYFVRARGLRAALPQLALASGLAALMLAPFVWSAPELFWFGTLRWLREYGPAHISWFFDRFGFLQLFQQHELLDYLPWAQWGLVAACLLGASLSKNLARIPSYAGSASLAFIMLNVLLWDSFLLDGAVAAAGVVIARAHAPVPSVAAQELSPRLQRSSLVALGSVLVVGAYLAFTLIETMRPRGRDAAHDFVVQAVKPGDFVIDRSDRRVAFVQGSWLLRREEVPAPIGGELYDGAWGGGPALTAPGRVWLISQARRDTLMRGSFALLGRQFEWSAFGSYVVQGIEPRRPAPIGATSLPDQAGMRRCQVGSSDADMLGVLVRAPSTALSFVAPKRSGSVLLAAGFANHDVVWPRQDVHAHFVGSAEDSGLALRNLGGMQWRAWETRSLPEGELRLELRTDDPEPRLVCLQLLGLP